MKMLFFAALPLYALDQFSKWWIVSNLAPLEERVVSDYFSICHWTNTGAAFSMGTGRNGFFIAISVVALAGLLIAYGRGALRDRLSSWGTALLVAGILGNLTDRIVHGHVVDFLLFDLKIRYANPWPAFNVADSLIFIAVVLFLIASFVEGRKKPAAEAPKSGDSNP